MVSVICVVVAFAELSFTVTVVTLLVSGLSSVFAVVSAEVVLFGHPTERLPGNINISFKSKSGEGLMHMLDLKGICVSTGSACDSVNQQVSHVINAIDVPADYRE